MSNHCPLGSQVDTNLSTTDQEDLLVVGSVLNVMVAERDHIARVVHETAPFGNLEG